jgi:hypothetical protein
MRTKAKNEMRVLRQLRLALRPPRPLATPRDNGGWAFFHLISSRKPDPGESSSMTRLQPSNLPSLASIRLAFYTSSPSSGAYAEGATVWFKYKLVLVQKLSNTKT